MTEKLLQLARLGLALLACCGYLRAAMGAFRLRPEQALPLCFAALGLAMLVAGVLGVLAPAVWLLLALGLVLLARSLLRGESPRDCLTPGMLFFGVCAAGFLVILYGSRLVHIDNFSHWGAILKLIEAGDALPAHNPLVYFPAYPTGSSLLIYWFSKAAGIHAEWFWAWSQSLVPAACAASLFTLPGDGEDRGLSVFTALTAPIALACLCGNTDPADLLVDTLVPMLGLAGLLLCLSCRERLDRLALPLTVYAAYLPMVKNSGYFFAGLLILSALLLGRGKRRWLAPGCMLLGLAAANRIWAWHVKTAFEGGMGSYHAVSLQSFGAAFAQKTPADLRGIALAVGRAILEEGRLVWLIAALAAALLLCALSGRKELRRQVLAVPGIWALYLVSLLGMYVFSMSVGEALRAAAFDRYYRIITVFCTGLLWALALPSLRALPERRRLPAGLAVCALLLALCAPQPRYLLRQSARMEDGLALRMRFDALIEDYDIPPEQSYLLLTTQENEISGRVMCTYLLWPKNTRVCTGPETLGEAEGGMDYYIVLDETEAAAALLEKLETADPCGWLG